MHLKQAYILSKQWGDPRGGVPEINVKQDTTDIADGGSYDLGSQEVGTYTDATFSIENTGTADLTLSGSPIITISGTNADQFSVQQQPASPVTPSGSTNFIIRFSPTSTGAKTAAIAIANNDSDENPYDITLNANSTLLKEDLLGTWDFQGVYYRNSNTEKWVKMATPADMVACGDIDGDNVDDVIGEWVGQSVWVKYSSTGIWARLATTSRHIDAGDMNGDGRVDLLGTWDGQGVFYKDSISGTWVQMASPAELVTAGDIDGDGIDDLLGVWSGQGGVWIKYSSTGTWDYLATAARDINAGKIRGEAGTSSLGDELLLFAPIGGYAEGPGNIEKYLNLSSEGPGGWDFIYVEEEHLIPQEKEIVKKKIPGPGEPRFVYVEQENLVPYNGLIKKTEKKK